MIFLNKLSNTVFVLNADLIETIEATPDTVIKLTSGKTYMVKNGVEEVVNKVIAYKQLSNQTIHISKKNPEENALEDQ